MNSSANHAPPSKRARRKVPWGSLSIVSWFLAPILWPFALLGGLWSVRRSLFPVGRRIDRSDYWIALGLYLCAGGLLAGIIYGVWQATKLPIGILYALYTVWFGGIAVSAITVGIGRLHDRNMSGAWLFLLYGVPAALIAVCNVTILSSDVRTLLAFPAACLVIWTIVALGFRRGTPGQNAYGADPVALEYERVRQRQAAARPKTVATPPAPPVAAASAVQAGSIPAASSLHATVSAGQAAAPVSQPAASLPASTANDHRDKIHRAIDDLFSFHGRFSRKKYWMYFAIQCAFAGIVWAAVNTATKSHAISQPAYWSSVGVLAFLPAGISALAIIVKRLHDQNSSGWWGPGLCVVGFIGMELLSLLYNHALFAWDNWGGGVGFAACIFWLIGSARGTIGDNRYGPDQVAPPPGVATRAPGQVQ